MYSITEYFDPLIGFDIVPARENFLIRRFYSMIFHAKALYQLRRYYQMIYRRGRSPPMQTDIHGANRIILNCNSRNRRAGTACNNRSGGQQEMTYLF